MSSDQEEYMTEDDLANLGEGFAKHGTDGEVLRYLSDWKLVNSKGRMVPLDGLKRGCVLRGTLQPVGANEAQPLSFQLKNTSKQPFSFCVDYGETDDNRGIWVQTSSSYYLLQKPHAAQDHARRRAHLGLISNLVDLFPLRHGAHKKHVDMLLKLTPEQVHKALACDSQVELESAQQHAANQSRHLSSTPFDLELLRADFDCGIASDLAIFFTDRKKTEFWTSLSAKKSLKKRKFSTAEYLESARQAEERSQQLPWGSRKEDSNGAIQPLWRLLQNEDINEQAMDFYNAQSTGLKRQRTDEAESSRKTRKAFASSKQLSSKRSGVVLDNNSDENGQEDTNDDALVSHSRMEQAVSFLRKFLLEADSQVPKDHSLPRWYRDFPFVPVVNPAKAEAMAKEVFQEGATLTTEAKLLTIASVHQSCIQDRNRREELTTKNFMKVGKIMIGKRNSCRVVFLEWKEQARMDLKEYGGEAASETSAALLLLALADFLKDFIVFHDRKMLKALKVKKNLDLIRLLNEILVLGTAKSIPLLEKSSQDAVALLERAMLPQYPAAENVATTVLPRAANRHTTDLALTSASPRVSSTAMTRDPAQKKNDARQDRIKQKKDEKAKEALRRAHLTTRNHPFARLGVILPASAEPSPKEVVLDSWSMKPSALWRLHRSRLNPN